MGCDDRACQKQLLEVYQEMYGHGEGNGVKGTVNCLQGEVKDTIKKRPFWTAIMFILVPVGLAVSAVAMNVWAVQRVYPHQFADKAAINRMERRVIVLEEGYKTIGRQLRDLDNIKKTNREILELLREMRGERNVSSEEGFFSYPR
jgi:hypothetical protein